jgi:hypothetical protein
MPACLHSFIRPLPLLFLIFPLYSTQSFTPTPSPSTPPPPSPFLGKFSISAYSAGGCSGSLANLTYDPNVVLFANPIVGTGSSCVPYARFISQNQTIYFSAKACGLALEVGLFNDSLCSSFVAEQMIFNGRCISDGRSSSSSVRAVCTSSPAPHPPPSSPFSGDFSVSLYPERGCSDNTTSPGIHIVGNSSSCLPFLALGQGFVYYMSPRACGQTFFEIGLFADSFCNLSDAQTIYIQIPNSQTQCSLLSSKIFATAVCTSSPPPVAPAPDASSGSSTGAASPAVIAGSVVGAIACKRRNSNPAHSLITFYPNAALSVCLPLIVLRSCRSGVGGVLAAKSVRHLVKWTLTSFFFALLAFYAVQL